MPVEYRDYGNGHTGVVATGCPRCGGDLDDQQSLADHLRNDCPTTQGGDAADA